MIKSNSNHACPKVASILQIPKPFQRKKQTKNRIKTYGYTQNDHIKHIKSCLREIQASNILSKSNLNVSLSTSIHSIQRGEKSYRQDGGTYVKKQLNEVAQPVGDINSSPYMSIGQLKQCMSHSLNLSNAKTQRITPNLSTKISYKLQKKDKPILTTRDSSTSLATENEILRTENEKLKQISEERKNQVSYLLRDLVDLKSQLTINLNPQMLQFQKTQEIQQILNFSDDIKETRSSIAKDICIKLRDIFSKRFKIYQRKQEIQYTFSQF